jgi:diguanylate cyclase (GGDEF)-like protein
MAGMPERELSAGGRPAIRLWQYLVAVVIPVVFVATPFFFLLRNLDRQLAQTRNGIAGVAVLGTIHEGMRLLQRSRGLSELAGIERRLFAAEIAELHRNYLQILAELEFSGAEFNLSPALREVRDQADRLFMENNLDNGFEPFEAHTSLIQKMLRLSRMVSVSSRLILDPEEETYFLIEIMANQLPDLIEAAGRLRARGSRLLAAGEWGWRQEVLLREHLAMLAANLERLEQKIALIRELDPKMGDLLLPVQNNKALDEFMVLATEVIHDPSFLPEPVVYFDAGSAAIDSYYEPLAAMRAVLTNLLMARQERLGQLKLFTILGTLMAVLLLILFSTAFYRQNRNAFRRIEELAVTDMLTGLHNRRFLGLVIDQELQRAKREGKSFTLGVLDIDYFKLYNDTSGHQAGDEVLRLVAESMKSSLQRAGDFLFRVGGEEFCFFFAGLAQDEAAGRAEKVREAVENMGISHPASKVSPVVTISLGGVYMRVVTDAAFDPIMKMADDALYEAKKAGRNRCRFKVAGSGPKEDSTKEEDSTKKMVEKRNS